MTPICSFNTDTSHIARHVVRCPEAATHSVQDRRPLPDGKLRPAMPSCEHHAIVLLGTGHYVVQFGLWAVK